MAADLGRLFGLSRAAGIADGLGERFAPRRSINESSETGVRCRAERGQALEVSIRSSSQAAIRDGSRATDQQV